MGSKILDIIARITYAITSWFVTVIRWIIDFFHWLFTSRNKLPLLIAGVVVIAILGLAIGLPLALRQHTSQATSSVKATVSIPTPIPYKDLVALPSYTNVFTVSVPAHLINTPGVYREELLFSAGSGSIDQPVFTSLYLYNTRTKLLKRIWQSKVKHGEIYETCISRYWFVWLDTDQFGNNVLYKYNRKSHTTSMVVECGNIKPKLRLYDNTLIWMEQFDENTDKLHLYDLPTDEDILLEDFTVPSYGMSAPCIYKDTIVWAGPDASVPEAQRKASKTSSIYMLDLNDQTLTPKTFSYGTYVHEPVSNGEATAWIDTNKSPDAQLYVKYSSQPPRVIAKGITAYGIGDDYVVYNLKQVVYAYYYKTNILARLSQPDHPAIMPIVNENTVAWFDITKGNEGDMLKYNIME